MITISDSNNSEINKSKKKKSGLDEVEEAGESSSLSHQSSHSES